MPFLLLFIEEDISLDIKQWKSKIKKPRNMSVQDFVQRLNNLNDLIDYTPIAEPTNNLLAWLAGKRPKYKQLPRQETILDLRT
jgi:hypothetical protein